MADLPLVLEAAYVWESRLLSRIWLLEAPRQAAPHVEPAIEQGCMKRVRLLFVLMDLNFWIVDKSFLECGGPSFIFERKVDPEVSAVIDDCTGQVRSDRFKLNSNRGFGYEHG